MWRVTWAEECREADREWEKQVDRAHAAEAELEALKAEVVEVVGGIINSIDYREDEHQRRSYAIWASMPRAFHAARDLLAKLKGEGQ